MKLIVFDVSECFSSNKCEYLYHKGPDKKFMEKEGEDYDCPPLLLSSFIFFLTLSLFYQDFKCLYMVGRNCFHSIESRGHCTCCSSIYGVKLVYQCTIHVIDIDICIF